MGRISPGSRSSSQTFTAGFYITSKIILIWVGGARAPEAHTNPIFGSPTNPILNRYLSYLGFKGGHPLCVGMRTMRLLPSVLATRPTPWGCRFCPTGAYQRAILVFSCIANAELENPQFSKPCKSRYRSNFRALAITVTTMRRSNLQSA